MVDNKSIIDRVNLMHTILHEKYTEDTFCSICPLMIKNFFNIQELDEIIENLIPTLNYSIRGIYFIPIRNKHRKLLYLFSDKDKKEKKKSSTLSFQIEKTMFPDVYDLYLNNNGNKIKHGIACVPNYEKSVFLNELFDKNVGNIIYVECEYNLKFKKWEPIKSSKFLSNISDI